MKLCKWACKRIPGFPSGSVICPCPIVQSAKGSAPFAVDIYFGLDKPEGDKAKNWIPTEAGRAWFPYFRLYSPKQAFMDRSWVLPDIEKAE